MKQGKLSIGQVIEIRPGRFKRNSDTMICIPLRSTITSLYSEKNKMKEAVCGGLIAIGTNLDPSLTKDDKFKGFDMKLRITVNPKPLLVLIDILLIF